MIQVSLSRIGVVALRVVRQLKRDRRTIGLIAFAPIVLMILFGYALSGEMSGVALGLVDEGGHPALRSHLEGIEDFEILRLGSESDAELLVSQGRLNGAVVLQPEEVRVLLDASSLQISQAILAAAQSGAQKEAASLQRPGVVTTRYLFGYDLEMMDTVGPAILGLVVFFFTFINAAISFIRERSQGTLEKFMVSPLSRVEIVLGYVLGFSLFTLLQSTTTLLVVTFGFKVPMRGNPLTALAVVLLLGAGALVLGSFLSNFARSEFQVVQFIPLIITPQIVLCGVWWPMQSIPEFIRPISYMLPLTYAGDALRAVMLKGSSLTEILFPDLLALAVFFLVFFAAATLMLRRQVD
ncbi:MAG: ABC-2 family transporter protein [Methanosaeta sp. PtaB.Bin018]|jgi:ABC-2 type transport system permease protein|nr:ABC transporter permease [Methanothrix sp.]OPX76411.1 MAG: ABC-2 family transporter protein [Methanosaeta sp. PtaB.Bin018]OPY43669.1 MAG: ABC-2 family transporter protein [Methanosaeta sp. PtaU1.Bin016]HOV51543.1 ABC transporter permease [Methanothrix sp.]